MKKADGLTGPAPGIDAATRTGDSEFHVWDQSPRAEEMDSWVAFWSPHLRGVRRVLDVACGEGHFLAALTRAGYQAEGVELTPSLVARARSQGRVVHEGDAVDFVQSRGADYDAFIALDFIEHIPFEAGARLLAAIPWGGRLILVTPNTNSVIGHQFYLQVPSHVAPYSPFVLGRMLERSGFERVAEGTLYGGLPWKGVRRKVTEWFLVRLLGAPMARLLMEGANYYVVGQKGPPSAI
jgi:2-polyprenyl-3-methyl-5-hydroxy-6-metoxy-1,4-benzoquinol methylase